jgi:hypothetical protein
MWAIWAGNGEISGKRKLSGVGSRKFDTAVLSLHVFSIP